MHAYASELQSTNECRAIQASYLLRHLEGSERRAVCKGEITDALNQRRPREGNCAKTHVVIERLFSY